MFSNSLPLPISHVYSVNILLCYSVLDFSFISVGVVCLCLCVRASVCLRIHTHAQEHMWTQKLVVDIFLSCYLPYFWDRVSYWTWSSPAYLGWLWSSYYFPSAGITDKCLASVRPSIHPLILWMPEIQTHFLLLVASILCLF